MHGNNLVFFSTGEITMHKKTADLIAKKAALEAYRLTIRKLAQVIEPEFTPGAEKGPALYLDPSKPATHRPLYALPGGELTYQPLNNKKVNPTQDPMHAGEEEDYDPNYFTDQERMLLQVHGPDAGAARKKPQVTDYELKKLLDETSKGQNWEGGDPNDPMYGGDVFRADDANYAKDKCPTCGGKKKEASINRLLSVAARMKTAIK